MTLNTDDAPSLDATSMDWRISNLRSAYIGILDNDAFEYELGRFQGLQEVKRRKIAATVEKFSYNAALQRFARILICWAVYTHIFFRLRCAVPFFIAWFLAKNDTDIPPLRWPFEVWDSWLMRRLIVTPSLFMLLVATFFGLETLLKRLWAKYRTLVLMVLGGCIVIFFTLVLG